jgi:hypothetical protein
MGRERLVRGVGICFETDMFMRPVSYSVRWALSRSRIGPLFGFLGRDYGEEERVTQRREGAKEAGESKRGGLVGIYHKDRKTQRTRRGACENVGNRTLRPASFSSSTPLHGDHRVEKSQKLAKPVTHTLGAFVVRGTGHA